MDASLTAAGGADNRVLQSRVICILWHAPGRTVDPELERGLKRWQGLFVTSCHSAPAAIAEVMSIERAMRSGKREPTVLLLVEPEKLIGVTDVLHTMDKYSFTTRCWCYDAGSSEMLRAVTPKDIANWTRIALERQRLSNPEGTPKVTVVPGVSVSRPVAAVQRPGLKIESSAIATGSAMGRTLDPLLPIEARCSDLDVPPLQMKGESGQESGLPKTSHGEPSDNKSVSPAKWAAGVSNVLTPDEMAMLLAEDDGRAHT